MNITEKFKIAEVIGQWYVDWKDKIVDNKVTHKLGFAKEDLKSRIEKAFENEKPSKITTKDLLDNYDKAMIIDMDKKNIFIIKNRKIESYVEKKYDEVLKLFGIENLEEFID